MVSVPTLINVVAIVGTHGIHSGKEKKRKKDDSPNGATPMDVTIYTASALSTLGVTASAGVAASYL